MWCFRAMNTDVTVAAPTLPAGLDAALAHEIAAVFADAERRFSRFLPDSELSRLNGSTGSFRASGEMIDALVAARRHFVETGGLFDPAIGEALEAAGYDRSFAKGALDREAPIPFARRAQFSEVSIDAPARVVSRPAGLRLDLGGIVKGRTIDRAAALLPEVGLVEAGGDAVLRGAGPAGEGWSVDVEDPADARRVIATLRVSDRAVATSAPNRRRWRAGTSPAHHLIDPRTGSPARSDLEQVTALGTTAEEADVLAKVAFLLGARDGTRYLEGRTGVGGVLVETDGRVRLVGDVEVEDA